MDNIASTYCALTEIYFFFAFPILLLTWIGNYQDAFFISIVNCFYIDCYFSSYFSHGVSRLIYLAHAYTHDATIALWDKDIKAYDAVGICGRENLRHKTICLDKELKHLCGGFCLRENLQTNMLHCWSAWKNSMRYTRCSFIPCGGFCSRENVLMSSSSRGSERT